MVTVTDGRRPRVVILGGGFAGLEAARRLDGERCDVTLIDRGADFEFLPNLHELVSRTRKRGSLRLARRRWLERHGHVFHQSAVVAIEPDRAQVRTEDGAALPYEALIVALGSAVSGQDTPGVAEHALSLRSAAAGVRIGERLEELADDGSRAVTIVGGGFTGVECLGEVLRRYRQRRGLAVRLVEPKRRLLARQPKVIHDALRDLCRELDVELLLGERVAALEPRRVQLVSGSALKSDLTLWTAGGAPSPLLAAAGLAPAGEWAPVRRTLQSRVFDNVFVAGDSAELERPLSKQSFHAVAMGKLAARNVERFLAGRELRRLDPPEERLLITFGYLSGFYVDDDVVLEGGLLCLGRELLFQAGMARLDRPRRAAAARRLRKRLRDSTRVESLPPQLRGVAPYPFGRPPRDRFDVPSLPWALEWRKAESLPDVAAASFSAFSRAESTVGEQAPPVLDFLSADRAAWSRGGPCVTRRMPPES